MTVDGDWRGIEWRAVTTAVDGHKLMAGFELQDNLRLDQAALDLAEPANDIRIPGSGQRVGVLLQDEWAVSPQLTATLGWRLDRSGSDGNHTSPRAAVIWAATPSTTLKALAGRAHRAPNVYEKAFGDGVSLAANPGLSGERIDTLEAVADHRIGTDLALHASAYEWTIHGLITQGIDLVSGLPQYQSEAGPLIRARGLELSADKTWAGGARLRGNLSLQNVRAAGGGALPNSPQRLARVNLSAPWPWAGWRVGYEMRYDDSRLSLDGTRLGAYAVSNLTLGTPAWVPGLGLWLAVTNLFDKRYAHTGADTNWQNAFEQDGRSLRASAEYRF
jgi:outer membrane receptor protein involved in Fe transport